MSVSASVLRTPASPQSGAITVSFTTSGAGEQEIDLKARPEKLVFEPGGTTVERQGVPAELDIKGRRATVVRLTDKGFVINDHGTRGIAALVYMVEGRPNLADRAREFSNRTPRELLALYEGPGRTALQAEKLIDPYKGLWITVEAVVEQVIPDSAGSTVVLRTQPARDLINARFAKEWDARLSRVNTGDQITIRGKVSETQNGQQLYLVECEM